MRLLPAGAGIAVGLLVVGAAAGFCFWPVAGRTAESCGCPSTVRHLARRLAGRHRYLSPAPQAGVELTIRQRPEPVPALPPAAEGLEILSANGRGGELVGVVKDRPRPQLHRGVGGTGGVVRAA